MVREGFASGVLAVGLLVMGWASGPAQAATFTDCSAIMGVGDAVTPNDGCNELDGVNNDDAAAMNMAPGAFGITTWTFLGRDNYQPEIGDIDIFDTGDAQSGTFSFDAAIVAGYSTVALVFKSAASADPCAVIAYLLEPGQTSGSFSTPFVCPMGDPQDISHLSLYGDASTRVPLPAGAVLLLTGLAGLGLMRGRRAA